MSVDAEFTVTFIVVASIALYMLAVIVCEEAPERFSEWARAILLAVGIGMLAGYLVNLAGAALGSWR